MPFSLFIVSAGHGSGLDETFLPRKCKNATKNVKPVDVKTNNYWLAPSYFQSRVHTVGIIYVIYTLSSKLLPGQKSPQSSAPSTVKHILATFYTLFIFTLVEVQDEDPEVARFLHLHKIPLPRGQTKTWPDSQRYLERCLVLSFS